MKSSIEKIEDFNKGNGTFSLLILIAILVAFAFATHFSPVQIGNDIITVASGDFTQVKLTLGESIVTILQFTLIILALNLIIIPFIPHGKSISMANIFQNGPIGIYLTIIAEEGFARWLFITVLGTWIFHVGYTGMIIFALLGNVIWALVHLSNYEDKSERKLIVVLPQFISGLLFAYLYIHFGFVIALFVHLTFDFVLMSADKKDFTLIDNIANLIYWLILAGIAYAIFQYNGIALPAITPWLNNILVAPTTELWPMVALLIFASSASGVLSNFLGLDHHDNLAAKSITNSGLLGIILTFTVATAIVIGLIMGMSWILTHFIASQFAIAIIISLILMLGGQPKSGSAMANLWFTDMPLTFLEVFVVLTFSFWPALAIITISSLTKYLPLVIQAVFAD